MPIKYSEAKSILAQYAGRGGKYPTADEIDLFVKQVFQYMLVSGDNNSLRKFCFNAVKGCITVPYELETPLKVRIDGQVGSVFNRWFEFYNYGELEGCVPASQAMYEEPNPYCTVYDPPSAFCRIGVIATADEAVDAHLIVSGQDASGREIFTDHEGQKISGEYLRIKKGELRYTQVAFANITSVLKTRTNGYVQLLWVRPETGSKGFLADYAPFEESPSYKRYKLTSPNCGPSVRVSVIGRIRLKDHYGDNEIIPFDNLLALQLAGQTQNSFYNKDLQVGAAQDQMFQNIVNRSNEYKRPQPGSPIDVFFPLSGGAIKGIV